MLALDAMSIEKNLTYTGWNKDNRSMSMWWISFERGINFARDSCQLPCRSVTGFVFTPCLEGLLGLHLCSGWITNVSVV